MHERIADRSFAKAKLDFKEAKKKAGKKEKTKDVFLKSELYDERVIDAADATQCLEGWRPNSFNISREALLKVITKYDIAPGACSHIRGQEQIFGSRTTRNEMNDVTAVGKFHL